MKLYFSRRYKNVTSILKVYIYLTANHLYFKSYLSPLLNESNISNCYISVSKHLHAKRK